MFRNAGYPEIRERSCVGSCLPRASCAPASFSYNRKKHFLRAIKTMCTHVCDTNICRPSSSGCFTPGLWLVLVRPLSAGTSMSVTNDASMNESLFSVFSMTTLLGLGVPVFLFVVLGLYCSVQRYRFVSSSLPSCRFFGRGFRVEKNLVHCRSCLPNLRSPETCLQSRGRVSRRSRVEIMEDASADQRPVESALRRSPPPLHVVFHPDASEDPCIGHEVDVESREQCGQVSATEIANSREISRSRGDNESNLGERGSGREEGRQGRRYPE
mmetsp:Transcript_27116/g.69862  ORF Transcript_27116/g.69862 Transcript_27116/m.69862 type:complete len:270 (-) Transcript_27116:264-1073(-)